MKAKGKYNIKIKEGINHINITKEVLSLGKTSIPLNQLLQLA